MLTGYAKAGTTIGTPAGQFVEPKDVMSAAVGVRSTRAIAAESAGGSSARICSGQIEVRAFPTAVIAPAKVSATATSTVPEAHSICDSARAASTSGGIGGVHAAMIMTAKGTRTMPRVRIDIRDIVLILNSFNQF